MASYEMRAGKDFASAVGMRPEQVKGDYDNQSSSIAFYIKETGMSEKQMGGFVDNYLRPIVKGLGIDKDISFLTAKEMSSRPEAFQANSLEVEIHDSKRQYYNSDFILRSDAMEKLNKFLNEHKKETAQAVNDIKNDKKPELPQQLLSENSSAQDHAKTIAEMSPGNLSTFANQLALNQKLHQESIAQQAQELGMG